MKIATGDAEQHPTPLPYNPQPSVAPVTPVASVPGGPTIAGRDTTGEYQAQRLAGIADVAAAQALGHGAETGRRQGYAGQMNPLGSSYGALMDLPPVVSDWSKHTGGSDATSYDPAG